MYEDSMKERAYRLIADNMGISQGNIDKHLKTSAMQSARFLPGLRDDGRIELRNGLWCLPRESLEHKLASQVWGCDLRL